MARLFFPFVAAALFCLLSVPAAGAAEREEWQPVLAVRFGNIDALDSEDSDLAAFVKGIRNDGRHIPPMRALVGPAIRNPTFFGLTYEAWMEIVLLAPSRPGDLQGVFVFPVDSRDEYMSHLASQGLSEYEGMDGVTVLRETGRDGDVLAWHLEWLPGDVAIFGPSREAVAAGRRLYAESGAARGLLAGAGGEYVNPDVTVRLETARLAGWRDSEPGRYWWREKVERLSGDLVAFWRPGAARARLIQTLTEEFVAWPRRVRRLELSVWFEREGVEWLLTAAGDMAAAPRGEPDALRFLPEATAMAYAAPLDPAAFASLGRSVGRLLLGGAGGVVTTEARRTAERIFGLLQAAGPRQAAAAWIAPPTARPDLGASRLLVMEWERPEVLDEAWEAIREAVRPGTPAAQAFSQLGWEATLTPDEAEPGAVRLTLRPGSGHEAEPYYDGLLVFRRRDGWTALASGRSRIDADARRQVASHRAGLAEDALARRDAGSPDARQTFTRVEARGSSLAGFLAPVRFMQLALLEAADWRPHSPDQREPPSAQAAREMLEYGEAGAWTMAGEGGDGEWRFHGGMTWRSLSRLSGALGITEAIGMD